MKAVFLLLFKILWGAHFQFWAGGAQILYYATACCTIYYLYSHFQTKLPKSVFISFSEHSFPIYESNNISAIKLLGIAILYSDEVIEQKSFFESKKTYLGRVELEKYKAECNANPVKITLTKFRLLLCNLVDIGTDNANVMIGINNSVYTHLNSIYPI